MRLRERHYVVITGIGQKAFADPRRASAQVKCVGGTRCIADHRDEIVFLRVLWCERLESAGDGIVARSDVDLVPTQVACRLGERDEQICGRE